MKVIQSTNEIERFWGNSFRYQTTFKTPLDDLPRFVETFQPLFVAGEGAVTVGLVVFSPENLLGLLAQHSLSPTSVEAKYFMHVTILASNRIETAALLEAALGDWVDFIFTCEDASLAFFADHDEYITFFSNEDGQIAALEKKLIGSGFIPIPGYEVDASCIEGFDTDKNDASR